MTSKLKSYANVYAIQEEILLNSEDGWKSIDIDITDVEVPGLQEPFQVTFHYRDVRQVAMSIWNDPELKDHLVLRPAEDWVETETPIDEEDMKQRVYGHPHRGDAWLHIQDLVEDHAAQIHSEQVALSAVVAALQLYSDSTLLNVKGKPCHPIRMTLLNVPYSQKSEHVHVAAYFPELQKGTDRSVKLAVYAKCLETLLQPLAEASKSGEYWKDSYGDEYLIFPRILSYVADDPEMRDLLCILGHMAKFACERCLALRDSFAEKVPSEDLGNRCPEDNKRSVEAAREGLVNADVTKAEVAGFCRDRSLPIVVSGLYTLFQEAALGGALYMHLIFGYDVLHNDDLALIPDLIKGVCGWLKSKRPKNYQRFYVRLNDLLSEVPRAEDFQQHSNGYFPDMPHAQAKEHRNCLQVLPFLIRTVLQEEFTKPAEKYEADQVVDAVCRYDYILSFMVNGFDAKLVN